MRLEDIRLGNIIEKRNGNNSVNRDPRYRGLFV